MADIYSKILDKYDINIEQENIFKLYEISEASISLEELENKINKAHEKWNKSINGANEKNAARAQERLNKADTYERILRDAKLRKELEKFYEKQSQVQNGSEFAKSYFDLVATTKRIDKQDVEFYFEYYKEEKKNKRAIIDMLKKDFMVIGINEKEIKEDDETAQPQKAEKAEKERFIVNLFKKNTVMDIQRCVTLFEEARKSQEISSRYPEIKTSSFYEFLEMEKHKSIEEFNEYILLKASENYDLKQDNRKDFQLLVDMYNGLKNLTQYKDVADNFYEFGLLIKYPSLTPYMYSFVDMKPDTIKGLAKVAEQEKYAFRNQEDMLLNYYIPIHDNFGISDSSVRSILKNAEKKAKANKLLNNIDKKFGWKKNTEKMPVVAEAVHFFVYWPVFVLYILFEFARSIFKWMNWVKYILFAFALVEFNILISDFLEIDNMMIFTQCTSKKGWYDAISFMTKPKNIAEAIVITLSALLMFFMVYVLPARFVMLTVEHVTNWINKEFDWLGIKRTFIDYFTNLRKTSAKEYKHNKSRFIKKSVSKIIINLVSTAFIVAIVLLAINII